jgi:hypothetical protein
MQASGGAQDGGTSSKLQALLVTMLPHGSSDETDLYCSIPVSLPSDDGAGATPATTLLVPCSNLPPGVTLGPSYMHRLDCFSPLLVVCSGFGEDI